MDTFWATFENDCILLIPTFGHTGADDDLKWFAAAAAVGVKNSDGKNIYCYYSVVICCEHVLKLA